jgi:DNA recombination-dependent growth factor C
MDPYKDKDKEILESKEILKYIKSNKNIPNFKLIWPDTITVKYIKLKDMLVSYK